MNEALDRSRVEAELRQFKNNKQIHDLPRIQHYWSNQFLKPKFQALGFTGMWDFYLKSVLAVRNRMQNAGRLLIVSIGSGNCDIEIMLAKCLIGAGEQDFLIECLDLNPQMLERGAASAERNNLLRHFVFTTTDLSDWQPAPDSIAVFFANQSLHHIEKLENLFDRVEAAMSPQGCLLTGDMIGRNGHMLWPNALAVVRAIWASMDETKRLNHRTLKIDAEFRNTDFSAHGFEGIRAQDILPLLVERFHQDVFLGFNGFVRPFISRAYGPNFDPNDEADTRFIRFIGTLDDSFIDEGVLKPTQCFATFGKVPSPKPLQHKHWTAAYCVQKTT